MQNMSVLNIPRLIYSLPVICALLTYCGPLAPLWAVNEKSLTPWLNIHAVEVNSVRIIYLVNHYQASSKNMTGSYTFFSRYRLTLQIHGNWYPIVHNFLKSRGVSKSASKTWKNLLKICQTVQHTSLLFHTVLANTGFFAQLSKLKCSHMYWIIFFSLNIHGAATNVVIK